jgi:ribosomal protein S27AE
MGVIKETKSLIAQHKSWSIAVKKRDNYICMKCGSDVFLVAHHINSWAKFPLERFSLDNGVTLCKKCHKEFHKVYGKISTKEKFIQFINNILPTIESKKLLTGCINKEKLTMQTGNKNPTYKHGLTKRGKVIREYKIWADIKTRCFNKNSRVFEHYGGRGISMCERWEKSFEDFLEDMGYAPSTKHSVDRIDVNKNYEPNNCKWATKDEQSNNTRSNKFITLDGKTQTYAQWEKELKLRKGTISQRKIQSDWTDKDCLSPMIKRGD